ncbi:unnamed protein product [Medioppia subpectinata]|uniref:Choline kinase n=1 Tax=Medioppia subpectinata TaxID=1979941 RepID=A0A7R9KNV8_9ACAR|nr:unnamed protein product [Medioppia subpectinata]CAG2107017.1 unnamed protein product [Medioppia subpectinata]
MDSNVWQRGITPADINEQCLRLCADYLGGVWLKLTADDIDVKIISAGIHSLEVPIKRNPKWIFRYYDHFYRLATDRFDINSMFNEYNLETLKAHDIYREMQWTERLVTKDHDFPIAFAHNDMSAANLMVTESDGIVVCDYEYSCIGYRGYDFGTLLLWWDRNGDSREPHAFPDDPSVRPLVDAYIRESIQLNGIQWATDARNSAQSLLREMKVFTLVSYLFYVLYYLSFNEWRSDLPFNKKISMDGTESWYKNYHKLKKQFIENNEI